MDAKHLSKAKALFIEVVALPEDAPAPGPITPIGPLDEAVQMAPFDAWMELLFGA